MAAPPEPSNQRQRTGASGGGGACIGDLPDALLSQIFEEIEYEDWCATSPCHM